MKTDPTLSIPPLTHRAISLGNQATDGSKIKSKPKSAISDTIETSDREGDGRQDFQSPHSPGNSGGNNISHDIPPENGGLLDLTG